MPTTKSIASVVAGPLENTTLTLERIPSGELAWLRPEPDGGDVCVSI
jgi:hypothetical protein